MTMPPLFRDYCCLRWFSCRCFRQIRRYDILITFCHWFCHDTPAMPSAITPMMPPLSLLSPLRFFFLRLILLACFAIISIRSDARCYWDAMMLPCRWLLRCHIDDAVMLTPLTRFSAITLVAFADAISMLIFSWCMMRFRRRHDDADDAAFRLPPLRLFADYWHAARFDIDSRLLMLRWYADDTPYWYYWCYADDFSLIIFAFFADAAFHDDYRYAAISMTLSLRHAFRLRFHASLITLWYHDIIYAIIIFWLRWLLRHYLFRRHIRHADIFRFLMIRCRCRLLSWAPFLYYDAFFWCFADDAFSFDATLLTYFFLRHAMPPAFCWWLPLSPWVSLILLTIRHYAADAASWLIRLTHAMMLP